jgi:hypothetical protein
MACLEFKVREGCTGVSQAQPPRLTGSGKNSRHSSARPDRLDAGA